VKIGEGGLIGWREMMEESGWLVRREKRKKK
jgi:hypothetical protein